MCKRILLRCFLHFIDLSFVQRLQWPGYDAYVNQKHAYTHSGNRTPVTRKQIARKVAQAIHDFMQVNYHRDHCLIRSIDTAFLQATAETQSKETSEDWHTSRISFDQLTLVELRNVSVGSWQPVICLAP